MRMTHAAPRDFRGKSVISQLICNLGVRKSMLLLLALDYTNRQRARSAEYRESSLVYHNLCYSEPLAV